MKLKNKLLKIMVLTLSILLVISIAYACKKNNDTGTTTDTDDVTNPDKITVKFDFNGGVGNTVSQEINKGEKATALDAPAREGYTFNGWSTTPYYLNEYNFDTAINGDLTLYAFWSHTNESLVQVNFDANGGMLGTANAKYIQGSLLVVNVMPTKNDKVFVGWSTTKDNAQTIKTMINNGDSSTITVYALWSDNTNSARLKNAALNSITKLSAIMADKPELEGEKSYFNLFDEISAYNYNKNDDNTLRLWYKNGIIYRYTNSEDAIKYPKSYDRAQLLPEVADYLTELLTYSEDVNVSDNNYKIEFDEVNYTFKIEDNLIKSLTITEIGEQNQTQDTTEQVTTPESEPITDITTDEITTIETDEESVEESESENNSTEESCETSELETDDIVPGDSEEEEGEVEGVSETNYNMMIEFKYDGKYDLPEIPTDITFTQKYLLTLNFAKKGVIREFIVDSGDISKEELINFAQQKFDDSNFKFYLEFEDAAFSNEITNDINLASNMIIFVKVIVINNNNNTTEQTQEETVPQTESTIEEEESQSEVEQTTEEQEESLPDGEQL